MHHVGPLQTRECDRQRRCDPHPPVAKRCRQIAHGCAVHDPDRRAKRGTRIEIDDRGGDDIDLVASRDQATDELTGRHDRAAEGTRRRPDGRGEEDAKTGLVHRY